MVTEHCLLTAEGPCSGRCVECGRRASRRFLVERDGTLLSVFVDARDALGRAGVAAFLCAPQGAPAW